MSISASPLLNGKIRLKVVSLAAATLYLYQQPNIFNDDVSGTHGIVENLRAYKLATSDTYEVPSDWTMYFFFDTLATSGYLNIETQVVHFGEGDDELLETEWQPTAAYYVSQEELDAVAAKEAEEERLFQEWLES